MKYGGIFLLFALLILKSFSVSGQGFVNHGASIIIQDSAFFIADNFSSEGNSQLDLDGTIILQGNWTNNSSDLFINCEPTPDGWVIFSPIESSIIDGNQSTNFENIRIKNQVKIHNNENRVKGVLSLEGSLMLNTNRFLLQNPSPAALEYISGYILSETLPAEGLGEIIWQIGNSNGTYLIPFGDGLSNNPNLSVELNIINPGVSSEGEYSFATFPTNSDNTPYPNNISSISPLNPLGTIDRFWKVNPSYYNNNPDIDLFLKYSISNLSQAQNTAIQVSNLSLAYHHANTQTWSVHEISSSTSEMFGALELKGDQSYDWFTLYSPNELSIPNAISPNGDGYNDYWILENCTDCQVKIYNRWGNKVFEHNNYSNQWDGEDLPSGAYFYIITKPDGEILTGDINILR